MYSPKLHQELVSKLYYIAKKRGIPMTELANEIIRDWLRTMEAGTLIDRIMEKYDVPQHTT